MSIDDCPRTVSNSVALNDLAAARLALDVAAASSGEFVSGDEATLFESVASRLDPRDAGDARRILRILWSSRALGASQREFLERVSIQASDSELRQVAAFACGQLSMFGGDFHAADRLMRQVLSESRGTGTRVERCAVLALGRISLQLRREFEALVLARHAARQMDDARDVWGAVNARLNMCAVFSLIGDFPRLSETIDEIDPLLDELPDPVRHTFATRSVHRRRAEVFRSRGDFDAALGALRAAEYVGGTLYPGERQFALILEADIESTRGSLERAADRLTVAASLGSPTDVSGLRIRARRLSLDARLGSTTTLDDADALLDDLRSHGGADIGPATRREFALRIARSLQPWPEALDVVRRAYDLAATAALERLIELDAFVREVPESGAPTVDDLAVLDQYRRRTERSQRETHVAVARLIADATRQGRMPPAVLPPNGELTCVCAWCQRVRTRDGTWLPIQQFLPLRLDGAIELTHGICESCIPSLRSQLREGGCVATR